MLSEARLLCDSVVVMSGGVVVYDGATTDFAGVDSTLDAVEDAFRRAVLGDLPPTPRPAPGAGR
jgi:ABC-type multidrug transport system ATPase subunit